jgi:hypothetical protein
VAPVVEKGAVTKDIYLPKGKILFKKISTFKKMLYISNKLSNLQVQSLQSNKGIWRDEVDPTHPLYTGPIWLEAYPAPLETLPYFTRASPLQ